MDIFEWNANFKTGLRVVDDQHHGLVELINDFGKAVTRSSGATWEEIDGIFEELMLYTQYHFDEEEQLMLAKGVDRRHCHEHLEAHRHFIRELNGVQLDREDRPEAADWLVKFLTSWLTYHILGTDQAMARQIQAIELGHSPQEAYREETLRRDGATGPLLGALSSLFQQVSLRNNELLELNHTLEATVATRTQALVEANELLERIALTDPLTDLPNRRHAMACLDGAWTRAVRDGTPLTCLMLDVDGFKEVNDSFGHHAGDHVLRQLSRRLRCTLRTDDVLCRLGGDEFLVICEKTDLPGALFVAEALRCVVAADQLSFDAGHAWSGSISVGVASKGSGMHGHEDLIRVADKALYRAKRNGRNCVEHCCADCIADQAEQRPCMTMYRLAGMKAAMPSLVPS
jgi:hemerythrin